jgi:undecaprenyl-diphosphatase
MKIMKDMRNRLNKKLEILPPLSRFSYYLITSMFLGISFFLLFCDLVEDMLDREVALFDQIITGIITAYRSPLTTEMMRLISDMSSPITIISIAFIAVWFLLVIKKHSWDALMLLIATAGAAFMNWILKLVFQRGRPDAPSLAQASGYSFPSGHAMISFVFYGMLIYLLLIHLKRSKSAYLVTFFIIILISAIGISRIYLGVHYPSDVLAGYAAGGFWLNGCITGLHTIRHLNNKIVEEQP